MNCIDKLNENWKKNGVNWKKGEIFVGSLDATALYPSLNTNKCAKMCRELVEKCEIEFLGVDYKWASLYLSLATKPWQRNAWQMTDLLPKRRFTKGQEPGVTGASDPMCQLRWRWSKPPEEYT